MITNELLVSLTEKERKLAYLQKKKKNDIQLFAANGKESFALIDNVALDPFNLIVGIASKEGEVCLGRHGDKQFSFPPIIQSPKPTRVWIDCRDNDTEFHLNSNEEYSKLSNEEGDEKLVYVLVHCPDFVQFSIYDGQLNYKKISHIFTASNRTGEKIRTIAYSMLNQRFPGLSNYLLELEGSNDVEE